MLPANEDLSGPLPAATDVAIIGGGLAGCALAYYLTRCGVEVVLLERGELNREASGTNAGSFHFQIAMHQLTGSGVETDRERLLSDVRLLAAAAEVWSGLEGELGTNLGVHVTGGLMVAETADELGILVTKQRIEEEAGLDTEVLTGARLRDFAPYLAPGLSGACYCAREGHANPLLAAPAFAARAIEAGARSAHARRRHRHRRGRLTSAVSLQGAHHGRHDRSAPGCQRGRRVGRGGGRAERAGRCRCGPRACTSMSPSPGSAMLTPMVQHIGRRLTLKQTANGTFIIGGGWPARPERAPERYSVRWQSAAGNAAVAVRVMPALADVRVMHMWTGVWASTDDFNPIIGEFAQRPGYFACVAPTGFTLGPIVARMLAESMAGAHEVGFRLSSDLSGRRFWPGAEDRRSGELVAIVENKLSSE